MRPNRKEKPKTWSRKGECPSCGVGGGSRHSKNCTFDYGKNKVMSFEEILAEEMKSKSFRDKFEKELQRLKRKNSIINPLYNRSTSIRERVNREAEIENWMDAGDSWIVVNEGGKQTMYSGPKYKQYMLEMNREILEKLDREEKSLWTRFKNLLNSLKP